MRGSDERTGSLFSYVRIEERLRPDHPLRAIRALTDETLAAMERELAALYSGIGRPSIAPQMLLRAMLLQAFYSMRSERQLMERMEFDLLFRWFVGLGADEPVWDASTFSKNRDRLGRQQSLHPGPGPSASPGTAPRCHLRACGRVPQLHSGGRPWAPINMFGDRRRLVAGALAGIDRLDALHRRPRLDHRAVDAEVTVSSTL